VPFWSPSRRPITTSLQRMILAPQGEEPPPANVTLATLKAGDTLDTLMMRVAGSRMVAAE